MNRNIVRKLLLAEASAPARLNLARSSAKVEGSAPQLTSKRRRKKHKAHQGKASSAHQKRNAPANLSLMTGKSPISKAKKMKMAAKHAVKRHQTVKETDSAVDRKTNQQLKGSQFRYLNELLYTRSSEDAAAMFAEDRTAFFAYHRGFESQRALWPEDPLRRVINFARTLPAGAVVADFGCGDARLAAALPKLTVHSFDFVAVNERVTACDMRKTPLSSDSVDLAVFSLALMGTNCNEFIAEANRVLKKKGSMKIVEITSRIQRVTRFVSQIEKMGFQCTEKKGGSISKGSSRAPSDYFSYFTFVKKASCPKDQLPLIVLDPCLYKKR